MDVPLLALYCEAFADWREARSEMEQYPNPDWEEGCDAPKMLGGKVHITGSGYPAVSPWVAMEKQCLKVMMDCLSLFGMSPSARTRININATTGNSQKTKKGGLLD